MNPDKCVKKELPQPWPDKTTWPSFEDEGDFPEYHPQVQMIVWRAVVTYLVLVIGAGAIMTLLDINPLVKNGLMPKSLLIFVSLSLLIALINTLTDFSQEHRGKWLELIVSWVRPTKLF